MELHPRNTLQFDVFTQCLVCSGSQTLYKSPQHTYSTSWMDFPSQLINILGNVIAFLPEATEIVFTAYVCICSIGNNIPRHWFQSHGYISHLIPNLRIWPNNDAFTTTYIHVYIYIDSFNLLFGLWELTPLFSITAMAVSSTGFFRPWPCKPSSVAKNAFDANWGEAVSKMAC